MHSQTLCQHPPHLIPPLPLRLVCSLWCCNLPLMESCECWVFVGGGLGTHWKQLFHSFESFPRCPFWFATCRCTLTEFVLTHPSCDCSYIKMCLLSVRSIRWYAFSPGANQKSGMHFVRPGLRLLFELGLRTTKTSCPFVISANYAELLAAF